MSGIRWTAAVLLVAAVTAGGAATAEASSRWRAGPGNYYASSADCQERGHQGEAARAWRESTCVAIPIGSGGVDPQGFEWYLEVR